MKRLGIMVVLVLVAVMAWVLSAQAMPGSLTDAELDELTAAGQPEVLIAATFNPTGGFTASGPVTLLGTLIYIFAPAENAQSGLRALVVNNVAGENGVANALNIQSANGNSQGGSQSNTINQSWGSTVDIGSSPSVPAGNSGVVNVANCVFSSCSAAGGAGAVGNRLSIYSDEVLIGTSVYKNPFMNFEVDLAPNAQSGLAALIVNNIAGINLVSTAVNVMSGQVNVVPGSGGNATVNPVGAGSMVGRQVNVINQGRGTPLSRP